MCIHPPRRINAILMRSKCSLTRLNVSYDHYIERNELTTYNTFDIFATPMIERHTISC